MKPYSSGIGAKLKAELGGLSREAFALKCLHSLQAVYIHPLQSMAGQRIDQSGIDHYTLDAEGESIVDAFQCKGFEVGDFGQSQLQQCLDSIMAFRESGYTCGAYYLIVNRYVKHPFLAKLEAALGGLVVAGKTRTATLLIPERFIEFLFARATEQLQLFFRDSLREFLTEHKERMEQDFYASDIPFLVEGQSDPERNPLGFINRQGVAIARLESNKRSWTFVVSEFGFGKTSLLLQLAHELSEAGFSCLYLPIAQFPQNVFVMEKEFLWPVLRTLRREDVSPDNLRDAIQLAALKAMFKSEKKIILLLDGVDEHPALYQERSLERLFNCIYAYKATCFFAVRKEYVDNRAGSFRQALHQHFRHTCFTILLMEWDDGLVLSFTQHFRELLDDEEARVRVIEFERLVESGQYPEYYGDIPKRPLFLKMVLTDVIQHGIKSRNLAELYTTCIERKFYADRSSSTANPCVLRPLSTQEDYAYVVARLFDIMSAVAHRMCFVQGTDLRLAPTIPESELRNIIANQKDITMDLTSVLLNSVMVPFGKRTTQTRGELTVKFAHKSFQEFFLARHAVEWLRGGTEPLPATLRAQLPHGVKVFVRGIVAMLDDKAQSEIKERCSDYNLLGLIEADGHRSPPLNDACQ